MTVSSSLHIYLFSLLLTALPSLISANPYALPLPLPLPLPQSDSAAANLTDPNAAKIPACLPPDNTPLLTDCMLALALIPSSTIERSFSRSARVTTDPYELPKVYEVGTCLVSVSFPAGHDRDESSWVEIGSLAHRMAMGCLKAEIVAGDGKGEGQTVKMTTAGEMRLGKFGFVAVKMWQTSPQARAEAEGLPPVQGQTLVQAPDGAVVAR